MTNMKQGKIKEVVKNIHRKVTGYKIEVQDEKELYFAHLGDLEQSEQMLYKRRDEGKLDMLKEDDIVSFRATNYGDPHAISVQKKK